ncbi:MAG: sigma 54-interacting transcriptional regulator [Nitrospirae bacterium]|nr:sigma 54-interacting transcriptional regulator [Nitrospirota bacterium]
MKALDAKQIDTEAVLDSLNDGVVTIGLDKKVKYLNKAAERLLGYSKEEAREMSCAQVVRCAACDHECLLEQTLSTSRNILNYETVLRNKSGRSVTVSTNTVLLKNKHGRVIGGVEIIRDRSQIEALNEALRGKYSFENIVGKNHRMQEVYALLPELAKTDSTVLIEGEPGTGKELLAHAIHQNSPRRDKPFVKVNCGEMTDSILIHELFGYVRGAFTGAVSSQIGRLELAEGGTLFLDEIGYLNPATQAKLLRFLTEHEFKREGDDRPIRADVRVVAATHRDLKSAIEPVGFRHDLYDRLREVSIALPPLRERRDDIPLLIQYFLKRFNNWMEKKIASVDPASLQILLNYDYPGNIQELENIIEHAVVLCQGHTILPLHLPKDIFYVKDDFVDLAMKREDPFKAVQRQLVFKVLSQTGWNYKEAAERLKISRTTLWRRINEFGINRPKMKTPYNP